MPAPTLHSDDVLCTKYFALSVPSPCDDSVIGIPCPVGTDKNYRWSICDEYGHCGLRLSDFLSKELCPLPPNVHTTWPELMAHLMNSSPCTDIEPDPRLSFDITEFCRGGPAVDIAEGRRVWICECPVCAFYPRFSFADALEGPLISLSCTQ